MITEDLPPFEQQATQYEPLYPPYEPPPTQGPVLRSALRYWWVIVLFMLALAGGAVAIGLDRKPTYTAEARLNVGGFNLSAQSLPGYAGGALVLANAYSRAAYADQVLGPVARAVGKSKREIGSKLSSSPVKDSPVIRVKVESRRRGEAIRIANLVAVHLQSYARHLARSNPDTPRLFRAYKRANRDYRDAVRRAERAARRHRGEDAAKTAVELRRLRLDSTAGLYQASLGGQATTNAVQLINPARSADSDRRSVLERMVAGGLLAGFAIGLGVAYLIGRNRIPGRIRS